MIKRMIPLPADPERRREIRNIIGWLATALALIAVVFGVGLAAGDQPLQQVPVGERGMSSCTDHKAELAVSTTETFSRTTDRGCG